MSQPPDAAVRLAVIPDLASLKAGVGRELAVSEWLAVEQSRIDCFADATGDHQWIHVNPPRAAAESPFGATVAHGFLTLSLLAKFAMDSIRIEGVRMGVNYGLNRVRFPSPVRVGSRVRGRFTLQSVEDIPGGVQVQWAATVDIEGGDKPACVAEMLSRWYA